MIDLKLIARLLTIVIAASLSSCIDGREEYWLQADGSGRAEITYHLPAAAAAANGGESGLRNLITDFLAHSPEITTSSCDIVSEEKRVRVHVNATFNSALALKDIVAVDTINTLPSAASHLAGDVSAKLRGRTLDFTRTIHTAKALPGSAFLPASQFEGHRMRYIMHLPTAASASNATRTEDDGRTLVWDIPLARAVKVPVTTRFTMEVPIPWGLVAAVAVPLSAVACGIHLRRRRSRKAFPDGHPRNPVL